MWQSVQVYILISLTLVWVLATAALMLRLVARRMTHISLWFDDYFCLAAYVSQQPCGSHLFYESHLTGLSLQVVAVANNGWFIQCEMCCVAFTRLGRQINTDIPLATKGSAMASVCD